MVENSWVADSKGSNWRKGWRVVRDWNKGCPWICSVQTLLKQDLPERQAHCPLGLERWRRAEEEKRVLVERHRELERWEKAVYSAMLISYSRVQHFKKIFIWLVLVVVWGIFVCGLQTLSCCTWDPLTRGWTQAPWIGSVATQPQAHQGSPRSPGVHCLTASLNLRKCRCACVGMPAQLLQSCLPLCDPLDCLPHQAHLSMGFFRQ